VAQLAVWDGSTLAFEEATGWYWVDDTLIITFFQFLAPENSSVSSLEIKRQKTSKKKRGEAAFG